MLKGRRRAKIILGLELFLLPKARERGLTTITYLDAVDSKKLDHKYGN
jgi:hypothetical protein